MRLGTDVTEADFLRAILAEPGDDAHRLVYADWLDEHAAAVPCPECWNRFFGGRCDACDGSGRAPDGRAARAEFIRVQCALARVRREAEPGHRYFDDPSADCGCGWHRQTLPLRRRERELLDAHGSDWLAAALPFLEFEEPVRDGLFCRGFVEEVTCTAEDWLRHGDAIRAAQPVARVELTTSFCFWPTLL